MHCSIDLDREERSACSRTSDITDVCQCLHLGGRQTLPSRSGGGSRLCVLPSSMQPVGHSIGLGKLPFCKRNWGMPGRHNKRFKSCIWQAACREQSSSLGNQFYKHPSSLSLQKGPPVSVLCVIWSVHCLHFVPSNCSSLTIKQWCSSASYRCRTEDPRENYLIQDQAGCLLQGKNSASQP